jgi:hypothetical protein
MTNTDDEMSSSDRLLMRALAEAIGGELPPVDLTARCQGLVAWIDVESELAGILDQPMTEAAGTRGASASAVVLGFASADGGIVVELTPVDDGLRGQLLGGESREVVARTVTGLTDSLPVDGLGGFSLSPPPSGTIRLEFELIADGRRIHTDWFVI